MKVKKKKLKKAQEQTKLIINAIWSCGDQDECSMKHVGHGVGMLKAKLDPSVQDNYVDYSWAGYSHDYSIYEEESEDCIFVESAFQSDLWKKVKEFYDEFGEDLFYGDIDNVPYAKFYFEQYYS